MLGAGLARIPAGRVLVLCVCAHPLTRWARRWFYLYKEYGYGMAESFALYFAEYFADLRSQMEFLAKLGYFRHAHATPALGGVGIDEAYMDRQRLDTDYLKARPAPTDYWNNAQERELLRACKEGDVATVKKLMAAGVDPNIRDMRDEKVEYAKFGKYSGASPLWYACLGGHAAIVELLHKGYCKLEEPSFNGGTAMHALCQGFEDALPDDRKLGFGRCFIMLGGKYGLAKLSLQDLNDDSNSPVRYASAKLMTVLPSLSMQDDSDVNKYLCH